MSHGNQTEPIPAAETTENASTEEPCQVCELKKRAPCDVVSLKVNVEGWKNDKLMLRHNSHMRNLEIRQKDLELQRMLRHDHDFVIDVIADARVTNKTDEKNRPAIINARATFDGLLCAEEHHGRLVVKVDGGDKYDMGGESEAVYAMPGSPTVANEKPIEVFAPRSVFDDVPPRYTGGDTVRNIFGILAGFFKMRHYKTVSITASSCGRRPTEDAKAPLSEMKAAVRIYRRSQMRVGVKIPPIGAFKTVRSRDSDLVYNERGLDPDQNAVTKSETTKQIGYGASGSKTSTTVYGDGIENPQDALYESKTEVMGIDGNRTTTEDLGIQAADGTRERIDGISSETVTRDSIRKRLQDAGGFQLIIAHNKNELDVLGLPKKIIETCVDLAKVLTDVQNLIKRLPRIGWSFEFEVKAFAGSILAEWYCDYVEKVQENGRHLGVDWILDLEIEMTIIDLTVKVAFGIRATSESLKTGVVIEVSGQIGGKASVGGRFKLDNSKKQDGCPIAANLTAELAVVGYLKAGGWTVADAKLTATGGLDIQNGRLLIDWDKRDLGLAGTLEWQPITITGYIESLFWDKRMDPYEVMKRTPFIKLDDWSYIPPP